MTPHLQHRGFTCTIEFDKNHGNRDYRIQKEVTTYRIIKIGMDVHSKNFTLCAMEPVIGAEDRIFANIQVPANYKNVLLFIADLRRKLQLDDNCDIQCGYEAGCLGYPTI